MNTITDEPNQKPARYHSALIILHWMIALTIIGMLTSGFVMEFAPLEKSAKFELYQLHKSTGVIVLWLVALRIITRLITTIPDLPAAINKMEQKLAKLGHLGLYAGMIIMPVSGWVLVSSSSYGLPTMVYNLFEWPHIPGISGNEAIHETGELLHGIGAYGLAFLVLAHIAATIKHAIKEKINLLPRMWWSKS